MPSFVSTAGVVLAMLLPTQQPLLSPERLVSPLGPLLPVRGYNPVSAFDGVHHLVCWSPVTYNGGVRCKLVSPDGTPVPGPAEVTALRSAPAVASSGAGFLVAATSSGSLDLAVIDSAGRLASSLAVPVPVAYTNRAPRMIWHGGSYLILFDLQGELRSLRVSAQGQLLDAAPRLLSASCGPYYSVALAHSSSTALALYPCFDSQTGSWRLLGARIDEAGMPMGPELTVIGENGDFREVAAASDGDRFLLVWGGPNVMESAWVEPNGAVTRRSQMPGDHWKLAYVSDGYSLLYRDATGIQLARIPRTLSAAPTVQAIDPAVFGSSIQAWDSIQAGGDHLLSLHIAPGSELAFAVLEPDGPVRVAPAPVGEEYAPALANGVALMGATLVVALARNEREAGEALVLSSTGAPVLIGEDLDAGWVMVCATRTQAIVTAAPTSLLMGADGSTTAVPSTRELCASTADRLVVLASDSLSNSPAITLIDPSGGPGQLFTLPGRYLRDLFADREVITVITYDRTCTPPTEDGPGSCTQINYVERLDPRTGALSIGQGFEVGSGFVFDGRRYLGLTPDALVRYDSNGGPAETIPWDAASGARLAFDGLGAFVAWQRGSDVVGSWFGEDGRFLDPNGFVIASGSSLDAVGGSEGRVFVAYHRFEGDPVRASRVFGRFAERAPTPDTDAGVPWDAALADAFEAGDDGDVFETGEGGDVFEVLDAGPVLGDAQPEDTGAQPGDLPRAQEGGCGCRTTREPPLPGVPILVLLAFVLAGRRRAQAIAVIGRSCKPPGGAS